MTELEPFLDRLWSDYLELNPDAQQIEALLRERGETIVNDHIAFRTFNDPRVNIEVLAQPFLEGGYQEGDRYAFEAKQLDARHYEHADANLPRIFISELRLQAFSPGLQDSVRELLAQVPEDAPTQADFLASGRPWELTQSTYQTLLDESEYAGWMAAFGFRPNHFTIHVNALSTFANIRELTAYLKEQGFALNTSGGEIKGSPEDYLEQASTLANEVDVSFSDGVARIPSCYYEFAQRYPLPDGTLFSGFVAKSADKIFESTDRQT